MQKIHRIPTFDANNRRVRNYSLAVIEYLLARGLVKVERSRRKRIIVRAQFVALETRSANSRSRVRHTGYSFPRHRGDKRDWILKALPGRRQIEPLFGELQPGESIAPFQRAIFSAVPLSTRKTA